MTRLAIALLVIGLAALSYAMYAIIWPPFIQHADLPFELSCSDIDDIKGIRRICTAYDKATRKRLWRAYSTGPDSDILDDPIFTGETGQQLDKALAALEVGKVAFEPEPEMFVGEPEDVEAVLGIDVPTSELESLVRTHVGQEIEIVQLKVSDVMAAELRGGEAFKIIPWGRAEQPVSRIEPNRWTWEVTPQVGGPQELSLVFYAYVEINGIERHRRLEPVLKQPIHVQVAWAGRMSQGLQFLKGLNEFLIMLAGAVSTIAGGLMLFRKKIQVYLGRGERNN